MSEATAYGLIGLTGVLSFLAGIAFDRFYRQREARSDRGVEA
ncbi:hypothetical protein [Natronobacterium haloterrestre]|nr:hypothetical protein [Halobiforma haloterrestris]